MAIEFKLDNTGQTDKVDLSLPPYIRLSGGWRTDYADGVTTETLDLAIEGEDDEIMDGVTALDNMAEKARLWHDDPLLPESEAYWLYLKAENETLKRALLVDLLTLPDNSGGMYNQLLGKDAAVFGLAIQRHPLWEAATSATAGSIVGLLGSVLAFASVAQYGNEPSRIKLGLSPVSGNPISGSNALKKLWIGIRPHYTTYAAFDPRLELEDGLLQGGAALATDATASPGGGGNTKVRVATVSTSGLQYYCSISIAQHDAANDLEYRGKYLVLLRCKIGAGTVGVQLRYGNAATYAPKVPLDEVYLTNTNWELVELGEVQIPSLNRIRDSINLDQESLLLYAEQVAGSATALDLDCLILIPSEHMVRVDRAFLYYSAGVNRDIAIVTYPDDEAQAYQYSELNIGYELEAGFTDFYLPVGGGVLVIAGDHHNGSDITFLTNALNMDLTTIQRFNNFHT